MKILIVMVSGPPLASNGITIVCSDASVGDTNGVNSIATRTNRSDLDTLVLSEEWSLLDPSCKWNYRYA